jgi:hypothetical protein
MELLVSYLYQIQLRTHAVLLLELFLLNDSHERSRDGRKLLRLTLVYCDSGLLAFFALISVLSDKGLDALAKSYDKFTA